MSDTLRQSIDELFLEHGAELSDNGILKYCYNNEEFVPGSSTIYYSGPYWDKAEAKAGVEAFLFGKWLSSGENVSRFEGQFSRKFTQKQSVMLNSGSSANLAMIAGLKETQGWKDGDEIIVCVSGFPTTVSAIIQNNLTPVFVDVSLTDMNWDLSQLDAAVTNKTRGVFLSPVLGNPCDMDNLTEICEDANISLIIDGCDSLGTKWQKKNLTTYGIATSCSFYPSHHISTGEGGMVSSNDPQLITAVRSYASWGRDCYCKGAANLLPCGSCNKRFDNWLPGMDDIVDHKYVYSRVGWNLKPLDLQGAIGSVQLKKFDRIKELRRLHKTWIDAIFNHVLPSVKTINEHKSAETSWFGVPLICETAEQKQALIAHLEKHKIQTRNYFAGNLLLHPGYAHLGTASDYPKAIDLFRRSFFLGCHPSYTEEMFAYIRLVVSQFPGART